MNDISKKSFLIICFLLIIYSLMILFLPDVCHEGDMGHWKRWSTYMLEHGLGRIYEYGSIYPSKFPCNYPPVILYFLKVYGSIQGTEQNIFEAYKYFKVIPLFFDMVAMGLIFCVVKPSRRTYHLPLFLLFNLAFLYNSFIWGQMDSIPVTFVLIAFLFAIRSKLNLSLLFYVLAINTKLQVIIFLPVLCIALLPELLKSVKRTVVAIFISVLVQVLILLPFFMEGTLHLWYEVVGGSVNNYTSISLQAFNFWYLIGVENPVSTGDYNLWIFGLSYQVWGFIMFGTLSFMSLLPLFINSLCLRKKGVKPDKSFREMIFLVAFIISVGFFFFNTQMHERYSHPALLMAFFFGLISRNYWLYALFSIAYFLNLEAVLRAFNLNIYNTSLFDPQFIGLLYLILLVLGVWLLFSRYNLRKDLRGLFITLNLSPSINRNQTL